MYLLLLGSDRATSNNTGLTTGRGAEKCIAVFTDNSRLSMAENSGDVEATRTLYIHEITVRSLNKTLQLVLLSFFFISRISEIVNHLKLIQESRLFSFI